MLVNNLLVDYVNFEAESPSSEYLQACTLYIGCGYKAKMGGTLSNDSEVGFH